MTTIAIGVLAAFWLLGAGFLLGALWEAGCFIAEPKPETVEPSNVLVLPNRQVSA